MLCFLAGCNNAPAESLQALEINETNSNDWQVFSKNNKYGYEDKNGFETLPANYLKAESFHDGVAIVETDSGYCLINFLGEQISEYYQEIKTDDEENLILHYIGKKQRQGSEESNTSFSENFESDFIDENVEELFEDFHESQNINTLDSFCLINRSGTQISKFYSSVEKCPGKNFYVGQYITDKEFNNKSCVLLDSTGNEASEFYDYISSEGPLFIITKKEKNALMNSEGKVVSSFYYDIDYVTQNDYYLVERDFFSTNSKGALDAEGNIIIPANFREISWNEKHQFYITSKYVGSKKFNGLYRQDGKEIYAPKQFIQAFEENDYIAISSGNRFALYLYENGEFVKKSDEYDVIHSDDVSYHKFLEFDFSISGTSDHLTEFYDGKACVRKNKKYGFIDDKLKVIVPFDYDYCDDKFVNGKCTVEQNGELFKIDETGKRVEEISL